MLQNPLCYRNPIGETCLGRLSSGEREMLFDETGILCDKINSVYMLSGMKELFPSIYKAADKCLMIPDILNYFLTGEMIHEPSEFSTTQLMDVGSGKISSAVMRKNGNIGNAVLRNRQPRRTDRIPERRTFRGKSGADYEIPVICVSLPRYSLRGGGHTRSGERFRLYQQRHLVPDRHRAGRAGPRPGR